MTGVSRGIGSSTIGHHLWCVVARVSYGTSPLPRPLAMLICTDVQLVARTKVVYADARAPNRTATSLLRSRLWDYLPRMNGPYTIAE